MDKSKEPLRRALAIFDDDRQMFIFRLNEELVRKGKRPQDTTHLNWWLNHGEIPAKVCIEIEAITEGKIKANDLRPDIFHTSGEN